MTETRHTLARPAAFHVMTKPIGPVCNLDCSYCFYLEKEKLYPSSGGFRMRDEVLDAYIRQYIEGQAAPEIHFAWQGGEPTLMGLPFFRKVVELQQRYSDERPIHNAIQTNGTLLDPDWCQFFAEHKFLVGLSVDGPRELHDTYRVDKNQKPTFDRVMRGLECLREARAEFNTLTVVNRRNSKQPLEVYEFLKAAGSTFHQFIPLVERAAAGRSPHGLDLAMPPDAEGAGGGEPVTPWSVKPEDYGDFLCAIFDSWSRRDIGQIFVQIFDVTLSNWVGAGGGICVFSEKCGSALAMEHNGDIYSCDHYVYPEYRQGNILETPLGDMVTSGRQRKFGSDKADTLPGYCRRCDVRFACHGECPKHRFATTPDGEPGLNYLCPAYKKFFHHVAPAMDLMKQLLHAQRPPDEAMGILAERERQRLWATAGRNDPCPCGSGKKYKQCCWADKRAPAKPG